MDPAFGNLFLIVAIFGIFYFLLLRPQRKRAERHRVLMESLQVGDEIVTYGGIYGEVKALRGEDLEVEVARGTTLRVLKNAVARKVVEEAGETASAGE